MKNRTTATLTVFVVVVMWMYFHSLSAAQANARDNADKYRLGDIVMSDLDENMFERLHGGNPPPARAPWTECDGKDVHDSDYAKLFADHSHDAVVDMRGRYARGQNPSTHGGNANGIDPTGNARTLQDQAIQHHHHDFTQPISSGWGVMNDARGGGDNQVARDGYGGGLTTAEVGGTETRPFTTVLHFYCRINN